MFLSRCCLRGPAALQIGRHAIRSASTASGGLVRAARLAHRSRLHQRQLVHPQWVPSRGKKRRAKGRGSSESSSKTNSGGLFSDQGDTYYEMLGVDPDASAQVIRAAYLRLAAKYHPDKGTGNVAAFKRVNQAYQTLRDPDKKRAYDLKLEMEADGEDVEDWEEQQNVSLDPKVNVNEGLLLIGSAMSFELPPAVCKFLAHLGVPQLGTNYRSYYLELLFLITSLLLGKQAYSTYNEWKILDLERLRQAQAALAEWTEGSKSAATPQQHSEAAATAVELGIIPDLDDPTRKRFVAGLSGLLLTTPAVTFWRRQHLSFKILPVHMLLSAVTGSLVVRFLSGPLIGMIEPLNSSSIWDAMLLNAGSLLQGSGTLTGASVGAIWAMRKGKMPKRALLPGILIGSVIGRTLAWVITRPVTGIWWGQPDYLLRLSALASQERVDTADVSSLQDSLSKQEADYADALASLEEAQMHADSMGRRVARTKFLLQRAQAAQVEATTEPAAVEPNESQPEASKPDSQQPGAGKTGGKKAK